MKSFYLPLLLVVGGNILYHISQKAVPKDANPLVTMMLAYAVGLALCALGSAFYPGEKTVWASVKESNWTFLLIGVGVAAVEIGFLLAYRAGWQISLAPIVSSIALTLLLVPIGIILYREQISLKNAFGIALCLVGLLLIGGEK